MGMYYYLWDRIWRDEDKELPATSLIWFSRCLVSTDGWHIKGPMMGETVHSTHGRGMLSVDEKSGRLRMAAFWVILNIPCNFWLVRGQKPWSMSCSASEMRKLNWRSPWDLTTTDGWVWVDLVETSHPGQSVEPRQLVRTKVRFAESLQSQGQWSLLRGCLSGCLSGSRRYPHQKWRHK